MIRALLDVAGPDGTLVAYVGWQDGPIDDLDVLAPVDRELVLAEQPTYVPTVGHARRETVASRKRSGPGTVTPSTMRRPSPAWKRSGRSSGAAPSRSAGSGDGSRRILHPGRPRPWRRPHGAGTGHVIDTRALTETAVELIEAAFGVPGAEVQE